MMTLEEAILYCEEVAEINQRIADNTDHNNWMDIAECDKCAYEYHQVAEWLRELKQYREQPEIVRCKDCDWWTKQEDSPQGRCELLQMYPTGGWFCGNARRREVTE